MILADVMPPTTDPLALIIGAGGAVIGALALVVWALVLSRVARIEGDIKELRDWLIGPDGMTVRFAKIEGRLNTAEAEIGALKAGTLSREVFDGAIKDQNNRLDELRGRTLDLDRKLEKVDRTLLTGQRSYSPPEGTPLPPRPPTPKR